MLSRLGDLDIHEVSILGSDAQYLRFENNYQYSDA